MKRVKAPSCFGGQLNAGGVAKMGGERANARTGERFRLSMK